ncbi:hypothetical protein JM79_3247 [Gramella sp. Hel_I_59]|uniref:hypothetical protein n=1 Tax=Gramella sp. Hel_I_59 TaxID=1249978 RepID=UPI00114D9BE3|nr:hypothetical protein [Gramella sp. Hel_I_59]TQI72289.1 hypothetical protein JM79_3247 [Gramella sp. Hel_I_59]
MGIFNRKSKINKGYQELLMEAPSIPDSTFLLEDEETNSSNQKLKNYFKKTDELYFWYFDEMVLKDFEGIPNKNFIFHKRKINSVKNLKDIVNQFYNHYGIDDNGAGMFDKQDTIDIKEGYWSGRTYTDSKHKHPALFSYDKNEGLDLTIFYTG